MTPLMYAAMSGATEVVELLIASGANVSAVDVSGKSKQFLDTTYSKRPYIIVWQEVVNLLKIRKLYKRC